MHSLAGVVQTRKPNSQTRTLAGVVQTLLYADFFYYYIVAVKEGSKFQLPG